MMEKIVYSKGDGTGEDFVQISEWEFEANDKIYTVYPVSMGESEVSCRIEADGKESFYATCQYLHRNRWAAGSLPSFKMGPTWAVAAMRLMFSKQTI